MAGSRVFKFGTIFRRVQGLMRSGALQEEERPMWYDIYAAFPPKNSPTFDSEVPQVEVPKILYPEDIIRVQFYKTFGNPDVVDLTNEQVPTTCQRFVNKYMELMGSETSPQDLFSKVTNLLRQEGIRLVAVPDAENPPAVKKAPTLAEKDVRQAGPILVADIFGETTVSRNPEEEQDYIIENDGDEKTAKV